MGGSSPGLVQQVAESERIFFIETNPLGLVSMLEASPGIGPGIKVLQTSALPLGYDAIEIANPRSTAWICSDGADYGARTRHLNLGKVALYQMS